MHKRLIALVIIFSFLFMGLISKTFYEQIIRGSTHVKRALSIRTIDFSSNEFSRGDILDRNGISLTDTAIRPTIIVYPRLISNHQEIARKINAINLKDIEPYYRGGVKIYPSPFLIHLDQEDTILVEKIAEIASPGVVVLPIKTRYGPNSLAEHIIGYIGYSENSTIKKGIKGIEGIFDNELAGTSPQRIITPILDARNNILVGLGYREIVMEKDLTQNDVYLTIDSRIQRITEDVLDSYGIMKGGIVVLNIETGQIVAAATRPSFDQRNPSQNLLGQNNQLERVIDYKSYPGSIFKVITAAAALEEGIVTPDTPFFCGGSSPDFHVTCPSPHGHLTFSEAMAHSCNVTFVDVGLRLGRDKFEEYSIDKFGFSVVEGKALDSKKARSNGIIGQEIFSATPLEIANMMATIARGGQHQNLENPWRNRLVQGISKQGKLLTSAEPPNYKKIYSIETSQSLQKMLTETNLSGSGRRAWVEGYGSAGKTGTPQSSINGEYHAWYSGYSPLDNPQYAIAILIEEIQFVERSRLQGGLHAAPLFKDIIEQTLSLN